MDHYSLAFSVSNLGPKSFQKLLNVFPSLEDAWSGSERDFLEIGIKDKTFAKFDKFRKSIAIEKYLEKLHKEKIIFISFLDENYPKYLATLSDPPIGLFCKGNIDLLAHELKIAVVGTRKVTEYGKGVTETIVGGLSQSGVCIVSGLALGVDGISHRVALENEAPTIAVLACGVDCCLPSENYSLYKRILDNNGLVISEYPLSQPPNKGTFLARNRIVASLSDGVLITEAAEGSGSLVTAEWGFKLNKKVFAVPGPINSQMMQGSLKLLKQGAILVTDSNDVLKEFSISNSQLSNKSKIQNLKLSKEEKAIVLLLENEGMTIDEIAKRTKITVHKLFALLSGLELRQIIKNTNGRFVVIR